MEWQPTPVFLPGESHGHSSLVGYSSWGLKESDMTKQFTLLLLLTPTLFYFFFLSKVCSLSYSSATLRIILPIKMALLLLLLLLLLLFVKQRHPLSQGELEDHLLDFSSHIVVSHPTLCNSMDCSLPGSFVHVILQASILE